MGCLSGFNVNLSTSSDLDKLVGMKMEWVRLCFDWAQIEPERGKVDWGLYDKAVNDAVSKGLKVYATLVQTPKWCGAYPNVVPDSFEWQCFVEELSSRYMDKISVYSLWNEPNSNQFWNGDLCSYIEIILVPSAHILHRKGLLVAAPDLSMKCSNFVSWLNKLVNYQSSYDVLSIHVYDKTVEAVEEAFSTGRYGFLQNFHMAWKPYNKWFDRIDKPVWITETGWCSDTIGVDEQSLQYLHLICNGVPSVDNVIAYELRDCNDQKFGVLNSDGSEKPSAMIIANV